ADPDIFYKVHRNSEKNKSHVETGGDRYMEGYLQGTHLACNVNRCGKRYAARDHIDGSPGAECMVEGQYPKGKKNGKRRWDFQVDDWKLEKFIWHTNRLLFILEPKKYYSTVFFGITSAMSFCATTSIFSFHSNKTSTV
ncbi:MAG: hypothetical protein ABI618_16995, partial [Nitrospirota bacterium]